MEKTLIARWESKSGKHWVNLYTDRYGATYEGVDCGGNLGNLTAVEAVVRMEERIARGGFQPDANKTPMRRVK